MTKDTFSMKVQREINQIPGSDFLIIAGGWNTPTSSLENTVRHVSGRLSIGDKCRSRPIHEPGLPRPPSAPTTVTKRLKSAVAVSVGVELVWLRMVGCLEDYKQELFLLRRLKAIPRAKHTKRRQPEPISGWLFKTA